MNMMSINDENLILSPNISLNQPISINETNNNNQSTTKLTSLNESLNNNNDQDKSDTQFNGQKILNDLTNLNNNILIDSNTKESLNVLSNKAYQLNKDDFNLSSTSSSIPQTPITPNYKDNNQFNQFDQQPTFNSNLINLTNSTVNEQKSKSKKYNNKNRDSSSSNGSNGSLIGLDSNQSITTNGNLLNQNINQKDERSVQWKFSKTHQKRFKRRFPSIEPEEQLIDWYSCALIADILLQGYLYISENYFAFYSNIFGYKTHVLVKVQDVLQITKEKTARIFPNAIGIHTKQNKFVFGSLLSRENTYKLLNEVRKNYVNLDNLNKEKIITDQSEDDLLLEDCTDNKLKSSLENIELNSNEIESSFIETTKTIKHSDNSPIHQSKLDTLSRRHRRSNSLKQFNIKDKLPKLDNNDLIKQSNLLNSTTKFYDTIFFKLSSIKSILRFDSESKSSFLILSISLLLFILFVIISILLIRINSAHDRLISISKYSHSISIPEELLNEMFKMIEIMKRNLNEISQLKSKFTNV